MLIGYTYTLFRLIFHTFMVILPRRHRISRTLIVNDNPVCYHYPPSPLSIIQQLHTHTLDVSKIHHTDYCSQYIPHKKRGKWVVRGRLRIAIYPYHGRNYLPRERERERKREREREREPELLHNWRLHTRACERWRLRRLENHLFTGSHSAGSCHVIAVAAVLVSCADVFLLMSVVFLSSCLRVCVCKGGIVFTFNC